MDNWHLHRVKWAIQHACMLKNTHTGDAAVSLMVALQKKQQIRLGATSGVTCALGKLAAADLVYLDRKSDLRI